MSQAMEMGNALWTQLNHLQTNSESRDHLKRKEKLNMSP